VPRPGACALRGPTCTPSRSGCSPEPHVVLTALDHSERLVVVQRAEISDQEREPGALLELDAVTGNLGVQTGRILAEPLEPGGGESELCASRSASSLDLSPGASLELKPSSAPRASLLTRMPPSCYGRWRRARPARRLARRAPLAGSRRGGGYDRPQLHRLLPRAQRQFWTRRFVAAEAGHYDPTSSHARTRR